MTLTAAFTLKIENLDFVVARGIFVSQTHIVLTGSNVLDQIISVLLGTSMFVGGVVGFVLDNTIPGNYILHTVNVEIFAWGKFSRFSRFCLRHEIYPNVKIKLICLYEGNMSSIVKITPM